MVKIDDEISDEFFAISSQNDIENFLKINKFTLFISDYSIKNYLKDNYTVNNLIANNKLILLEDKNYIFNNN
jgi:hypothetical protein